jgi:hypothetical protein
MLSKLKFFNILRTESGVSVAMILVALALVTSATVYISDLNKVNKVTFSKARSSSFSELERKRIGAVLGDKTTCTLSGNFGISTNVPVRSNITSLVTGDNVTPFIVKDSVYYNKMYRVTGIETRVSTTPSATKTAQGLINSKQYELVVTYALNHPGSIGGGKPLVVRVPMYFKLDGTGKIADCFALVGNTNAEQIVTYACSPVTGSNYKNSYSTVTTQATVNECVHTATFDAGANVTDCSTLSNNSQTFLNRITLNAGILSTTAATDCSTGLSGFGNCLSDQAVYNITSSAVNCAYPGGTSVVGHDSGCAAGELLYHGIGATSSCVSVNCPTTAQFVQSVSNASTTCFQAPNTSCGANQYVSSFNTSGTDTCSALPSFSGACGASYYGISVSKSTTTSGNQLQCGFLDKTKTCSGATATTYVTSFNVGTIANCTTY